MTTINSKEYEWASIKIMMLGKLVTGVTKISYKKKMEKEARYAMGDTAHSIQHGNRSVDGSIEITQSEAIALNLTARAAGYRDILDVEFDIIVTYTKGGVLAIDTIKFASLTEDPREMTQGDKSMKVNVPFIALDVIEL